MTISPQLGWATVAANAGISTGHQVFWHVVTRLGEMQIVLPAGLMTASALYWSAGARNTVRKWIGMVALATLLTIASKLAFIGWGLGWPEANFTGISGHAMLAAALYPLILAGLVSGKGVAWRKGAATFGFGLAILIGMSRIIVGAHSASEVVAGLLLGCAASGAAIDLDALAHAAAGRALGAVAAVWFILMPVYAPPSQTHSIIVRASLALSGHKAPHTRNDMLRTARKQVSLHRATAHQPRPTAA